MIKEDYNENIFKPLEEAGMNPVWWNKNFHNAERKYHNAMLPRNFDNWTEAEVVDVIKSVHRNYLEGV